MLSHDSLVSSDRVPKIPATFRRKIPTTMPAKGQRCPEKSQEFSVNPWFLSEFRKLPQNQQTLQTSLCSSLNSTRWFLTSRVLIYTWLMKPLWLTVKRWPLWIGRPCSFFVHRLVEMLRLVGFRGFPARGADPPISMYLGNSGIKKTTSRW